VWRRHRNAPASVRVLALLRPVVAGLVLAAALGLFAACVLPVMIGEGGFDARTIDWRGLVVFALVGGATWRYRVNPLLGMAGGALAGLVLYSL
jgi:chromate transport protein ChrA